MCSKKKYESMKKNYAIYVPMCLRKKYESIEKTMLTKCLCVFKKNRI